MLLPASKIIGTLVPLSALYSTSSQIPTFEVGELFLDWLARSKQNAWVMLPLSETQLEIGSADKHVSSPYKGYGIGLDPRYLPISSVSPDKQWIDKNDYWLATYSLFCALRDHFGTDDWRLWEKDICRYSPHAKTVWQKKLHKEIEAHKLLQCRLHAAHKMLRIHAKKNNILLIGDVPFYMSLQSPLVWSHQDLFEIGTDGELTVVSGVLWGHFDRQIWGHPLYKWGDIAQRGKVVDLWKMRLRYHVLLFDVIRLDHIKGFFKFGALDLLDKSRDTYVQGPGEKVLAQLLEYAKHIGLKIFVEDSGHYKLEEFIKAAKKHSLASMKIYRFAYNEKKHLVSKHSADIIHYPQNSIIYTTTHDTETLMGYLKLLSKKEKQVLGQFIKKNYIDDRSFAIAIRNAIIASPAGMVIIPIQDWLLTKERINIPGTERQKNDPNWRYRIPNPVEQLPMPLYT